jgi:hypothetical protein
MNNSRSFRVLLFQQQPKISYAYDRSFSFTSSLSTTTEDYVGLWNNNRYKIYAVIDVLQLQMVYVSGRDQTNHQQRIYLV